LEGPSERKRFLKGEESQSSVRRENRTLREILERNQFGGGMAKGTLKMGETAKGKQPQKKKRKWRRQGVGRRVGTLNPSTESNQIGETFEETGGQQAATGSKFLIQLKGTGNVGKKGMEMVLGSEGFKKRECGTGGIGEGLNFKPSGRASWEDKMGRNL